MPKGEGFKYLHESQQIYSNAVKWIEEKPIGTEDIARTWGCGLRGLEESWAAAFGEGDMQLTRLLVWRAEWQVWKWKARTKQQRREAGEKGKGWGLRAGPRNSSWVIILEVPGAVKIPRLLYCLAVLTEGGTWVPERQRKWWRNRSSINLSYFNYCRLTVYICGVQCGFSTWGQYAAIMSGWLEHHAPFHVK